MSSIIGCQQCGSTDLRMQEWWAADALWLHVVGQFEGVLCPPCFDFAAKRRGWFLRWEPVQYPGVPGPLDLPVTEGMSHGEMLQTIGRSMAAKVARAEELIVILQRERDAAQQEAAHYRKLYREIGGAE